MTEEIIKDLQSRISFVEARLMTPVITRKDIKIFVTIGVSTVVLIALMLIGELYMLRQINNVYAILDASTP